MTLLLREDDVRAVLTMPAAIDVLEAAFRQQGRGATRNVPRARMGVPEGRGVLHMLAAYVPGQPGHPEREGTGVFGFKSYSSFPDGVRFFITLYSGEDGRLLALIEADWLGQVRTGAASGLATRHMARQDAAVVGLIGTGGQARTQLLAMTAVRTIEQALVYGRDAARQRTFCEELAALLGVAVLPVESARAAVERADIVVTATTAREPVLHGAWLRSGTHVNAMGSNWHNRREVDDETIERSAIVVVDALDQARVEAGDLLIPAAVGRFDFARAIELGTIAAGKASGRTAASEVTLFKSLGIGLEDVAVAGHVYALAHERGLGREIDLLP